MLESLLLQIPNQPPRSATMYFGVFYVYLLRGNLKQATLLLFLHLACFELRSNFIVLAQIVYPLILAGAPG